MAYLLPLDKCPAVVYKLLFFKRVLPFLTVNFGSDFLENIDVNSNK